MKNQKTLLKSVGVGILAVAFAAATPFAPSAQSGDWSFSIHAPRFHHWRHSPYRIYHRDYAVGWDYYPTYNPVVERDVYYDGHYHRDGTYHDEQTVEDRHASYYSPGRNEAITPPRTTVQESYGPGYNAEREKTSWIGADGRPHSTTIDRVTTVDPWGNTQTDTHVTLKKRGGGNEPSQEVQVQTPGGSKPPKSETGKVPKSPGR